MEKLRITVFADPVCTWCWGSVPVLRAIEYRLDKNVDIEYVMCGMIEDIRTFVNRRLQIGGDTALSNRNMMKAWLEASVVHGMPVKEQGFHLFSEQYPSTFPQNIAYVAAKLCCAHRVGENGDIARANRFLRRVQQATAVEAMQTSRPEVLADLAAVEGFDPEEFRQTMDSDAAKIAFADDRERARHYDVKDFPTFLIEYDGRETILRGYTTYNAFVKEILELGKGDIPARLFRHSGSESDCCAPTIKNVKRFIQRYKSVFPVEIATAFGLVRRSGRSAVNIESYEQLPDIVDELLKSGEIGMSPVGNSFKLFDLKEPANVSRMREKELHHSW